MISSPSWLLALQVDLCRTALPGAINPAHLDAEPCTHDGWPVRELLIVADAAVDQ